MPSSPMVATCAGSVWSASRPACTCGCSVLTRPPRISGKPVTSSTGVTGMPSVADARRGRAGRDDLDAGLVQPAGEFVQAGLVVDADQRAANGDACHVVISWHSWRIVATYKRLLRRLDAGAQGVLVVVRLDRDDGLGDHRAGVDALVDPVHGDAGRRRRRPPARRRPRARPGNAGSSDGWVLIDAEPVHDRRCEDAHEAGEDDEVGLVRRDRVGDGVVPGGAVGWSARATAKVSTPRSRARSIAAQSRTSVPAATTSRRTTDRQRRRGPPAGCFRSPRRGRRGGPARGNPTRRACPSVALPSDASRVGARPPCPARRSTGRALPTATSRAFAASRPLGPTCEPARTSRRVPAGSGAMRRRRRSRQSSRPRGRRPGQPDPRGRRPDRRQPAAADRPAALPRQHGHRQAGERRGQHGITHPEPEPARAPDDPRDGDTRDEWRGDQQRPDERRRAAAVRERAEQRERWAARRERPCPSRRRRCRSRPRSRARPGRTSRRSPRWARRARREQDRHARPAAADLTRERGDAGVVHDERTGDEQARRTRRMRRGRQPRRGRTAAASPGAAPAAVRRVPTTARTRPRR